MLKKVAEAFLETQIDDEIVINLGETGEFLSIKGTGSEIWSRIDGTCDRLQLIGALAEEFDAPKDEIAADVDAFLSHLLDVGLIVEG